MTMDLLLEKILAGTGMMQPSFANIHSDASISIILLEDSAYESFQIRKSKLVLNQLNLSVSCVQINLLQIPQLLLIHELMI